MTDTTVDTDTTYHKRISVAAAPDTVFALLTEPDRLRRWQSVVSTVDLSIGGTFRHLVVPGHVASGTFTDIDPGRRLVYTFDWAEEPGDPATASMVTVELTADGDRTIIDFTHAGLPDADAVANHAEGWNHFLDRLETAATTGTAGLNPWATGAEDLDELDAAEASLALMLELLRDASADDLTRPTPCSEFTVAQLVDHLAGSLTHLGQVADADPPPVAPTAPVETRIAELAGSTLQAWRRRGIDGEVEFVGGPSPAIVPVRVIVAELFVHAWDIARGLDQPFRAADHTTAAADGAVRDVIPPDRGDAFAAPRPENGLEPVEALMAFTGRQV